MILTQINNPCLLKLLLPRLKSIKNSAQKETVTIEKNLASEEELVENIDEEDQGNKSLEWDHSDETPPSFAEETWDSNKTVDEIIQNIEDLDKSLENSNEGVGHHGSFLLWLRSKCP